ncbi:MAG TPA: hypothetical protein VGG64_15930 [Pirellulales bacterium]
MMRIYPAVVAAIRFYCVTTLAVTMSAETVSRGADDSSPVNERASLDPLDDQAKGAPKPLGFLGPPPNSGPPNGIVKRRTPPPGMQAAIAWLEAIQDTRRRNEPGKVEVDWLALHAVVDGADRVLKQENFDDTICGGLYMRKPWFGDGSLAGNRFLELPATFGGGAATLKVSDRPEKVWHWYGCGRSTLPPGTDRVWCEARVRLTGSAALSLGLDYWRDEDIQYDPHRKTIVEAGDTRWFTDADLSDWTVISFAKPM